jgi:3-oxoacyl-[acyl-carrier-protein] synthase III
MQTRIGLSGLGHAVGSTVISNVEVAKSLGLPSDWFVERTGIHQRRICGDGEDVISLAMSAVTRACADARLDLHTLGQETVLMHIQNGFTHLTPPAAVVLAGQLGLDGVRVMGLDGVCAEPIAALDAAVCLLEAGRCERVILSSAVDFLSYINPKDPDTAGLFGAGAGALILSNDTRHDRELLIGGLHWESHTRSWQMGEIEVQQIRKSDTGVHIDTGFYEMRGQSLYRQALRVLPRVIETTLEQAKWNNDDVELIVIHQPNARLLELASRRLDLNLDVMPMPGRTLGNMGPASLLVNLSLARDEGMLKPGTRVLLLAFGLGFSCGAAAIEV